MNIVKPLNDYGLALCSFFSEPFTDVESEVPYAVTEIKQTSDLYTKGY
jgi:hypothetical protein